MTSKRILVFANEKGGTGKSTTAMHTAIALLRSGQRVSCVDLDSRQATFGHYVRNRRAFAELKGVALPVPDVVEFSYSTDAARDAAAAEDARNLIGLIQRLGERSDTVLLDCPGSDVPVVRTAIGHADTLITPLNDSFIDLDLLGEIGGSPPKVLGPSVFSQTVWEARQARAARGLGAIDWIVLRNRLSPIDSRNKRNVGVTLGQLADRMGFRQVDGFYERVIFRQMFLQGLTVLDLKDDGSDPALNLSHVAARQEINRLLAAIESRQQGNASGSAAGSSTANQAGRDAGLPANRGSGASRAAGALPQKKPVVDKRVEAPVGRASPDSTPAADVEARPAYD